MTKQPEIIEAIYEFDESEYSGFRIKTTEQMIEIKIYSAQLCCESWGYICNQDDTCDYIGAELFDIVRINEDLDTIASLKKKLGTVRFDSGDVIFVNVITNRGTLQFTVYNSNNGYYGHHVIIESKQFSIETDL
jgi:hypothetical protein